MIHINPFGVRMPHELKQWLKERATENQRSLNGEVVKRLSDSRQHEESMPQGAQA